MGVRFPSIRTNAFIGPFPASAAETVIFTTPPLNISQDFADVYLSWFLAVTVGATITSFAMRIRRGTTAAGALVGAGPWSFTTVAGNLLSISGSYFDVPGAVGAQQYSLTAVQTAGTGASTFTDGALLAFSL